MMSFKQTPILSAKKAVTEAAEILEEKISKIQQKVSLELGKSKLYQNDLKEYGTIISTQDGVARVYGLTGLKAGEIVEFDSGLKGIALTLESDDAGIVSLGNINKEIDTKDSVRATGEVASVPVGDDYFGRVYNTLGEPIDGGPPIKAAERRLIETVAPGVVHRKSVHEALQTGIMVIDALVPIGRGQRELILGDRGTGKTAIALDAILASKATNDDNDPNTMMKFIYVA